MSWIPGWDTIAGAHWWANAYFWAGIGALVALGIFEIVSHRYTERQEELAAIQAKETKSEHDLEIGRLHSETAALTALAEKYRAAIADAEANAADANDRAKQAVLELAKLQSPRTLRPEQQQEIKRLLKDAPKGPISVSSPFTDSTDAAPFAASIKEALIKAGFTIVDPPEPLKSVMNWDRPGAWMLVHNLKQGLPAYGGSIQRAFAAIGIYLEGVEKPKEVPEGALVIAVSSHPLKPEPIPASLLDGPPK